MHLKKQSLALTLVLVGQWLYISFPGIEYIKLMILFVAEGQGLGGEGVGAAK